jgi:hypothetical protein
MARAREERQWTCEVGRQFLLENILRGGYSAPAGHLVRVILALFVQVPDRLYFLRHRDVAQFR